MSLVCLFHGALLHIFLFLIYRDPHLGDRQAHRQARPRVHLLYVSLSSANKICALCFIHSFLFAGASTRPSTRPSAGTSSRPSSGPPSRSSSRSPSGIMTFILLFFVHFLAFVSFVVKIFSSLVLVQFNMEPSFVGSSAILSVSCAEILTFFKPLSTNQNIRFVTG